MREAKGQAVAALATTEKFIKLGIITMRNKLRFYLIAWFLVGAVSIAHAADELDAVPNLMSSPPCKWFASTDKNHKNADYLMLKPGETRTVKLGAGTLLRLWSTALEPAKMKLVLENGQVTTLLDNGKASRGEFYKQAYVLYPTPADPDTIRQMSAASALTVTNHSEKENKWFYQVAIRPASPPSPATPQAATSIGKATGEVAPGKKFEIFRRDKATGIVDEIAVTVQNANQDIWQHLRLRAWWDGGSQTPKQSVAAIDVPLLSLAGQFWSANKVVSAIYSFDGKSLRLHVPMPFKDGALITLSNDGPPAGVSCSYKLRDLNSKAVPEVRFCAAYGSARTEKGKPVQMLNVQGSGLFCGLNLGIEPAPGVNRRSFAYLEGNEALEVDGAKYEGTGTEDFFNSAWYFPDEAFSRPHHGVTYKHPLPPQVSAYRLLVPDAMPFQKSFNFVFEHGNGNNDNDLLYRWVAFWYQKPPLQFQITDALRNAPAGAENGAVTTRGASPIPVSAIIAFVVVDTVVVLLVLFFVLRRRSKSA